MPGPIHLPASFGDASKEATSSWVWTTGEIGTTLRDTG